MKVLIIGGVAGGASAAARLRRLDEHAQIVILERGDYVSYANCGLPYYISGVIDDASELTLQTPQSLYARYRIDVRVGHEAVEIDRAQKTVSVRRLADGSVYQETYDKLILSPGAEPLVPKFVGKSCDRVFTLRNIPDTLKIHAFVKKQSPKSAVVVGAGYIGMEMAENLCKAGLAVTVAEYADQMMTPIDFDLICEAQNYVRKKGVVLRLNQRVDGISEADGKVLVQIGEETLTTDMVVLSVGVRPESRLARECGLRCNDGGAVAVDAQMRTSDADIYAVGDVTETRDYQTGNDTYVPLAGPANKQGRIAADHISGLPSAYRGTQGSSILKLFDMTVACTGLNEKKAQRFHVRYEKTYLWSASHASYYPGASNMSVKVLFDPESGKLLGAQLIGFDGVDKRCDVFATAIRAGMCADDLAELELAYAPPFSSAKDPVNMAGFVMQNVLSGRLKQYFWNEIEQVKRREATILDVREPAEFERGHIAGAVNIPLHALRERMDSLERTKPVYVNCHSGMRSYIACRMLMQSGFDCYNLAGGYRLYDTIQKNLAE